MRYFGCLKNDYSEHYGTIFLPLCLPQDMDNILTSTLGSCINTTSFFQALP